MRRPTLLAAVLLKARSLLVHSQPADQREDLLMLLSLIDDPGACAEELSSNERRWLRAVAEPLALDGPTPATFTGAQLMSARAAFAVLTR